MRGSRYFGSSLSEVFLGKGVLKICSKFAGEHLCWSVISIKLLCNFIKITLRHGCYPVNFLHIFRTPFSKNTSGGLLLDSLTTFSLNKTGRQKMFLNYFCFSQSSRKDVDAQIVNSDVFYCFSTYLLRVLIVSCFLEIKWQIFLSQLCDTKSDLINCVLNNNWYLINTLNAKFLKCFDQIQNCVCKISCTA